MRGPGRGSINAVRALGGTASTQLPSGVLCHAGDGHDEYLAVQAGALVFGQGGCQHQMPGRPAQVG